MKIADSFSTRQHYEKNQVGANFPRVEVWPVRNLELSESEHSFAFNQKENVGACWM